MEIAVAKIDEEIREDLEAEGEDRPEKKKFTDWENEPEVKDLKQDFEDSRSDHDTHVSKVNGWLDNLNIEGKAKVKKVKGHSSIVPKLIRKQAEWRYASLSEPFLSTDDLFNAAPASWEDKESAKQNGLVLNHQFNNQIHKIKFVDEFVRAAVDEGTAIVRVGWDFAENEQEVEVPDFQVVPIQDPQQAQMVQQAIQLMQQGGQEAQQIPPEIIEAAQLSLQVGRLVQRVQMGSHMEMQMVTIRNQPTVEVCDYNNVIIDPSCMGDIDKAGFVIFSFETSLSELKQAGIYSNLGQINTDANSILSTPDHESEEDLSFNFTDEPRKRFVAYEYWGFWDIHDTGSVEPIVSTWVGDTMIRMEENPFPDKKIPFVTVQYLPVRRSIFGEPDGELLEDNQKIIGAVTRGMIDIMGRSANGQTGTRKDALDVTNKRKYDRGLDYEFNGGIDPKQAFHMHTFPEIPQSAAVMLNMQNSEAESLTGVKAFAQSGITGQALGETATGIKSAMDATAKRELGILRRLADGVKNIGYKISSMNGEFLSEEEIIRVTNEEFVVVRRVDLDGRFDLKLSISTAEADNAKAQELSFMLQTMGNTMPPEMSQIILAEIATLRKMPTLAKRIEEYKPQPDPIAEERAQLENDKLRAEIAEKQSQAQENMAEAGLDAARTQTESAKARNLTSDSDLKDLNFVEQESGVTRQHDEDMANKDRNTKVGLEMMKQQGNPTTSNGLESV